MAEPVIGIDLGTTFSAVATVDDSTPRIVPNRAGGKLTPSMVGFLPAGERVIGERARLLAEELPQNVAFATKRFIGRRYTDELAASAKQLVPYGLKPGPSGDVRVEVAGRVLPVTQISAMVLGELRLDAQAYFGKAVRKAVITVPANFDDGQRQATKEAARIAGLEVLRIINEPTAAAVAYGLTSQFEGRALVFDLGGGTFDVSILEVETGVFQVRATGGDPFLGGEDFDNRIVQWLLAQIDPGLKEAVAADKLSMQRLKVAAERAKRHLSENNEVVISVTDLGDHSSRQARRTQIETALTRSFFETLSEPLLRRCLSVCETVMTEGQLQTKDITAVLLVGGMTRVPMVRRLVTDFFGKNPSPGINPDEVVALGAAIHAAELKDQSGSSLLIDVASHSLGVGTFGGRVRRLIKKNTTIPVVAKEMFVPSHANQKEARIPIFQGEGEKAADNTRLGELVLRNLSGDARGQVPIEVEFELSSEGTLSVRVTDVTQSLTEAIQIEARTDLSGGEVQKLAAQEDEYLAVHSAEDLKVNQAVFSKMVASAEKMCRVLEETALEAPSEQAQTAVASVKTLVAQAQGALEAGNAELMADLARQLGKMIKTPPRHEG